MTAARHDPPCDRCGKSVGPSGWDHCDECLDVMEAERVGRRQALGAMVRKQIADNPRQLLHPRSRKDGEV